VVNLKLKLMVSEKHIETFSGFNVQYSFAVLDMDKASSYPLNYVCMLPKELKRVSSSQSKFLEIYGEKSNQVALELLSKTIKHETNLKVRVELETRLKALQVKPPAKCPSCGCDFAPKRYGYFLQTVCRACRYKGNNRQ
jgi:hypothetical protein